MYIKKKIVTFHFMANRYFKNEFIHVLASNTEKITNKI